MPLPGKLRCFGRYLFYILFFCNAPAWALKAPWIAQLRPLHDAVLINTPDQNHDLIVRAIRQAKSKVQMSMYHLTDSEVIQALIDAQIRGIDVQVILDNSSLQNPKYKEVFDRLVAGKVVVLASSPQFRITHSKMFIVDGNLAFVSTMNLVGHFDNMRDFGIFTVDPTVIRELVTVFEADVINSRNNTFHTPTVSHANLLWSPVNSEKKIVDLIDSADRSVSLAVENLGSDVVLAALVRARQRGALVRVLTPECDLHPNPLWNYPFMRQMAKAGVENRVMPTPSSASTPYMHAKIIVVDDRVAYLGSENFSVSSLRYSREVGVALTSPKTVRGLAAVYSRDWQAARPLPATDPSCPKMQ